MIGYALRRILRGLSTLLGTTLLIFILVRVVPVRPELKLGVVTALIGAPFLFGLIYRLREEA